MTEEQAIKVLLMIETHGGLAFKAKEMAIEALKQKSCKDAISRKSIKHKLQEHHDFFVNAYGGFSNLPQNDKSRVDEILNCIAMVVNEPSVKPQDCDTCEVGNPCLYCKHEFEPQESEG